MSHEIKTLHMTFYGDWIIFFDNKSQRFVLGSLILGYEDMYVFHIAIIQLVKYGHTICRNHTICISNGMAQKYPVAFWKNPPWLRKCNIISMWIINATLLHVALAHWGLYKEIRNFVIISISFIPKGVVTDGSPSQGAKHANSVCVMSSSWY